MVMKKVLIRPTLPLAPGFSSIGPLDQYMMRILMPVMCVFKLGAPHDRTAVLRSLQGGLAQTIDEMNFLAATIVIEDEDRQSVQLEYDSDNTGVWFHENDVPELEYESLAARGFPFSEMTMSRFTPPDLRDEPGQGCAVLSVQATFITGGVVVAFIGHHALVDGQSLGTMAQTWARNTHAISDGRIAPLEDRLSPEACDPSPTFGGCANRSLGDFYTRKFADHHPYGHHQDRVRQAALANDREELESLAPLSHWYMSKDALDRLKAATMPPDSSQVSVTEHPSISALIWRHVSRARQLNKYNVETSSLFGGLNVRRRMDPRLPAEYCFNA